MFKNTLLILASLLIALLVGEAALRIMGYDPAFVNPLNAFHKGDSKLGWEGVADFSARFEKPEFNVLVESNSEGFRARKSPVKPTGNAKQIFFIGDSFTWGWGVNNGEVFTDVLQTVLGANYNVQNYGVNAYGTTQEMLLFKRLLNHGKQPDSLYLMVFSNDFSDNLDSRRGKRPYYAIENGTPVLKNSPVADRLGNWTKKLRRHSYVLTFLSYWINTYQTLRDQADLESQVVTAKQTQVSVSDNAYAVMRELLAQFQTIAQRNNASFHVVYIPVKQDFAGGAPYRQALLHLCQGLNIPIIDLTPAFADDPGKYHIVGDEHWTVAGHQRAAEVLKNEIQQ